jgi:hypothetical protein
MAEPTSKNQQPKNQQPKNQQPKNQQPKDQQHPQWESDRQVANTLLAGEPSDYNLAELARLRIRYRGFPGARDIQADMEKVLNRWQITEEELFAKTRQIHQTSQIYRGRSNQREDWS